MELNPNHKVTSGMRDQWHKIVVLLMTKFKENHIEISLQEIEQMTKSGIGAVAITEKKDRLVLDLVSMEEAERLAKLEGGLPN